MHEITTLAQFNQVLSEQPLELQQRVFKFVRCGYLVGAVDMLERHLSHTLDTDQTVLQV